MALTVRELLVKINVKGNATKKLGSFKGVLTDVRSGLDLVVRGVTNVGRAFATVTTDIAKRGDEIAKTSKKIGISAESLQELAFGANLAGVEMPKLAKGILTLEKNLNDARVKGTGPMIDALDSLGVGIEEFDGLNPDQAFERFADIVATVEDPIQKAAIASDVMGRSGKDLIPLLNGGSKAIQEMREEFRELGGGFTNDGAAAAEEFIDAQLRLTTVLDSVKIAVGTELLPIIQEVVDNTRVWFKANKDLISSRIREFIEKVISAGKRLAPVFMSFLGFMVNELPKVIELIGGMSDAIGGPASLLTAMAALKLSFSGFPGMVVGLGVILGTFLGNLASDLAGVTAEIEKARATSKRVKAENRVLEKGTTSIEKLTALAKNKELGDIDDATFERLIKDARKGIVTTGGIEQGGRGLGAISKRQRQANLVESQLRRERGLQTETAEEGRRAAGEADRKRQAQALLDTRKRRLDAQKGPGKGKGKGEDAVDDAELLSLIQRAGVSGESLTGLIGDRKITGGPPPVITVTINRTDVNQSVNASVEVNGVPGQSAEELGRMVEAKQREVLREEFRNAMDDLSPTEAR